MWVHASCEGFTKDQYRAFSDLSKSFPNIAYCCKLNGCLTHLNQLMAINSKSKPSVEINEVLKDLKKNYFQVNEAITTLFKNIDSLSSNHTALNNKVNTIESSLSQLKPSQRANTVTRDAASKIVDEYRDMERRQWNLIISNAPESESTDSALGKSEDKKFFDSLMDSIGVGPVDIVNIVHLGTKSSGKLRPLRVQFNSIEQRRIVLANARKLRDSTSAVFRKGINPELSRQQRHTQEKEGRRNRYFHTSGPYCEAIKI